MYQESEGKLQALHGDVGKVLDASKLLMAQLEPQAAHVIQSEARLLSRDLAHLRQALVKTREQLQVSRTNNTYVTDPSAMPRNCQTNENISAHDFICMSRRRRWKIMSFSVLI